MSLANLVPASVKPSAEEADVLLELAYLSTAADGRLDDEELAAFKVIVGRLRGTSRATPTSTRCSIASRRTSTTRRSVSACRSSRRAPDGLRPLAFKLAVGLGVADLDASADESDLQVLLAEALGLDDGRVDELTAEVYASLDAGEDE